MTKPIKRIDNENLKNLISKNVFFSAATNVLYLTTRLFIPPLTLSKVSLEEYGIWATCFIVIGYLGMGVSGIANTYIRYVGIYNDRHDITSINRLLSTGLTISTVGGLVALVGIWFGMDALIQGFNIPPHLHHTAFVLFFGTVFIFISELSWGAFSYVLIGLQRIAEEKMVWAVAFLLEAVFIVTFLLLGFGIFSLLWAFGLRYLFSVTANVVLSYRALPGLSVRLSKPDPVFLKKIIHFGGITQVNGILNMALGSIGKVMAGLFLNIKAVGLLDLGQKFPRMAIKIPGSLTLAIFPAATHLHHGERHEEIEKLYLRGCRYINLMAGVMMGFMAAFSGPLMAGWLGADEKFQVVALLLTIFTLAFHYHTTTGPATAIFKGLGKPLREGVYPITKFIYVVILTSVAYWVNGWTVLGIGMAVSGSFVLSTLTYMFFANAKLKIPQWRFISVVLLPGLTPYLVGFLLFQGMGPIFEGVTEDRWMTIFWVLVSGFTHTLICGLLIVFLICDRHERHYFLTQVKILLKGLKRLLGRS